MTWAGKYVKVSCRSHITPPFKQAHSGNFQHDSRPLRRELNLRQREHNQIKKKKDSLANNSPWHKIWMTVIKSRFHSNREFIKELDIDCFRKYFALGTIMNGKTKNLTQSSTLLIKKQHSTPFKDGVRKGGGGCRLLRFPLPSNWSALCNIAITKARYEYRQTFTAVTAAYTVPNKRIHSCAMGLVVMSVAAGTLKSISAHTDSG
jgi:hypothetical protein